MVVREELKPDKAEEILCRAPNMSATAAGCLGRYLDGCLKDELSLEQE